MDITENELINHSCEVNRMYKIDNIWIKYRCFAYKNQIWIPLN